MRAIIVLFPIVIASPVLAEAAPPTVHWSAAVNASTSSVINGMISNKPQFGASLNGQSGKTYFGANIVTANSGNGTDSQDQIFAGFNQSLKPFNLRYQVTYKVYPGTYDTLTDQSLNYQMTASRSLMGINYAVGVEYSDEDYATTRKSYGVNLSVSRGLLPKLSGWLSVSHKRQWGSVDYTNTNIGLYYQATSKVGVSTSINNWHAYADWAHDRPTISVSLSRRL